jgi:bifunctional ADP-heptose synthase (sugar kinase/adenylyltransferase)
MDRDLLAMVASCSSWVVGRAIEDDQLKQMVVKNELDRWLDRLHVNDSKSRLRLVSPKTQLWRIDYGPCGWNHS